MQIHACRALHPAAFRLPKEDEKKKMDKTDLSVLHKHIKEVPTAMAVSFMTLWSLWAFLLLVLFLKSAFAHQAEVVFRRDYRTM